MLSIWATGMVTGFGLIVAIGAQNAFVLRQGLRREHIGAVVALCIISDALLIFGGTAGIGALVSRFPAVLDILRWAGAAYLAWWGIRSLISAARPSALEAQAPRAKGTVILTTLALTFLNPHVYLDTVVLLGSLANQYGSDTRWIFAAGAAVGSLIWFTALGYGARSLSGLLNRPRTWQIVDLLIGVVMLFLAVRLVLG
ncbi:LysE/ArgO family amino acid transporter [Arthrobacter sp. zg-Y1171]|uniref:LysE/ArgO family amino acid transporter n=1 Tax=Arthrobacter sp. zg-Y1171 TaxID=2964610 RepID=UPI00210292F1|nr:LysE/ArgO family amino acid transporter [Arthrobacter sp. zg-Y1171]MCQ1996577.1 LysE/ArgO family amino acid transporter [Arthrobacter sp. zg-Y1171]UWX82176.1 LysE/ArgO family amino acid transporter [Arthrobacter sp. zg-Y1171]